MKLSELFKKLFGKKQPEPAVIDDPLDIYGTDGEGDSALDNESGLTGFCYHYDGTIGGNNYTISVKKTDEGYALSYASMEHREFGEMTGPLDAAFVSALDELLKRHHITRWNGFSKVARGVCDGDGFSLEVKYEDKKTVRASGSNACPRGYCEFKRDMMSMFTPKLEELLSVEQKKIIAAGIKGELGSYMVCFKEQGTGGRDSYNFFVMKQEYRQKNVDIQIDAKKDGVFPAGKKRYYSALPDEAIDFAGLKELIEKYKVIEWYDFHEASEDPHNSEWFQISFSFENVTISAMGTAHPPRYDEFRTEFLENQKCFIERAVKENGLTEYV